MLKAFHLGDLKTFYELKPSWEKQNDLLLNQQKLEEKIRLLCLMEVSNVSLPPPPLSLSQCSICCLFVVGI